MADSLRKRPFDNFRVAITDPPYFSGRSELLDAVKRSPFQVRILLGGRRIGKTSVLRAVEWNLLNLDPGKTSLTEQTQRQGTEDSGKTRPSWVKTLFPTFSKVLGSKTEPERPHKTLVSPMRETIRAFPVFISLQVEQPKTLDSFRYLLIARLREAMDRWRRVPGNALREMYRQFISQVESGEVTVGFLSTINMKLKVSNPDHDKQLTHDDFRKALLKTINELQEWQFDGVCFLLDGAEFVVSQEWANDAWSYLRGLKDTDTALKPFVGFLLSGYRNLRDYQQAVGSPLLNIAEVDWLTPLTITETQALVAQRVEAEQIPLTDAEISTVMNLSGYHPYLTQQILNHILDDHLKETPRPFDNLRAELLRQHDRDFSAWWNDTQRPYSFGENERTVYQALIACRKGTAESLSQHTHLSYGEIADVLEALTGTGVILKTDDECYAIGSQLFEEWVIQQQPIV